MSSDTIVTLDGNENWYLADETIQNGKKYFLAIKLLENNEPSEISKIYEEEIDNEEEYLNEVVDETLLKYLSAVFVTNLNDRVNDLETA